MKRYHLFEWEDQAWFPSRLRDLMTDYLRHVTVLFKMHEPIVPILDQTLKATNSDTIIDLASGGGGPWPALAPALRDIHPNLKVVLTDLYPNVKALEAVRQTAPDVIEVRKESIDALHVPDDLPGLRTQFLSLHHFEPAHVKLIFQNAITARQPIAVFEFQQRTPAHILQFALSPIFVQLLSFMIRPFSVARLLFTYGLPLVSFFVMWDGIVSALRTYTPDEVRAIITTIPEANLYDWDIRAEKAGQVTVFRAVGTPR